MMNTPSEPQGEQIEQGELDAAFRAVREFADSTKFGHMISDADCRKLATIVVVAVEDYRAGKVI